MKVSVDFETRSPVDLKTRGPFVYFEHADTTVLMAAYKIDAGPIKIWTYDQPKPADLCAAIVAGAEIHAYNASFEALGFDLLADRHGWPRPRLDQFRDTAAAASAMALPRALGDAAAALGLDVQKDKEGSRLIRLFSIPRKPKKDEPPGLYWNEPADHPADWALFQSYCRRDVEVEESAARRMVPLSNGEQALWVLDQRINRRGIRIDRQSARSALRLAEKAKKTLDGEMKAVTSGAVTACSQVSRLVEWIASQGVEMTSLAKAEITDLLEIEDLPAAVRSALLLRQEAAKTSVSKLTAMLERASADGRMRGSFIFCGARTRRWSSVGANVANLPRPRKEFSAMQEDGSMRPSCPVQCFPHRRAQLPDAALRRPARAAVASHLGRAPKLHLGGAAP
jgi:DNA polymerase